MFLIQKLPKGKRHHIVQFRDEVCGSYQTYCFQFGWKTGNFWKDRELKNEGKLVEVVRVNECELQEMIDRKLICKRCEKKWKGIKKAA